MEIEKTFPIVSTLYLLLWKGSVVFVAILEYKNLFISQKVASMVMKSATCLHTIKMPRYTAIPPSKFQQSKKRNPVPEPDSPFEL